MSSQKRLLKALSDAIPNGEHPNPHDEWVNIRLDFLQEAIDHIEWLDKGNAEWRSVATGNGKQAEAARATARVAIGHLQAVLNRPRTHEEQHRANALARDWLISIGSEP